MLVRVRATTVGSQNDDVVLGCIFFFFLTKVESDSCKTSCIIFTHTNKHTHTDTRTPTRIKQKLRGPGAGGSAGFN